MRSTSSGSGAAAIAALIFALSAGCQPQTPRLKVKVCGDVKIPWEVDALRVELLGPDRQPRAQPIVDLLQCPAGRVNELPQSVSFEPFNGNAWARVKGLKLRGENENRVVLEYERRMELKRDERSSVKVAVNRDCLGITCPEGQTCVGGECRLAPRRSTSKTNCTSTGKNGTMPDVGMPGTDVTSDTGDMPADTSRMGDASSMGGTDVGPREPASLCEGGSDSSSDAGESGDLEMN